MKVVEETFSCKGNVNIKRGCGHGSKLIVPVS